MHRPQVAFQPEPHRSVGGKDHRHALDRRLPTQNVDHLLLHIKEHYYVQSLIENAVKRYPVCKFSRDFLTACWIARDAKHTQHAEAKKYLASEYMQGIAKRDLVKSLHRYILEQLGSSSRRERKE